jgi:hypothetical protein
VIPLAVAVVAIVVAATLLPWGAAMWVTLAAIGLALGLSLGFRR